MTQPARKPQNTREARLQQIEELKDKYQKTSENINLLQKQITTRSNQLDEMKSTLVRLQEENRNPGDLEERCDLAQKKINELFVQQTRLVEEKDATNKLLHKLQTEKDAPRKVTPAEIDAAEKAVIDAQADVVRIAGLIDAQEAMLSTVSNDVASLEAMTPDIKADIAEGKKKDSDLTAHKEAIASAKVAAAKVDEVNREIQQTITGLSSRLEKAKAELEVKKSEQHAVIQDAILFEADKAAQQYIKAANALVDAYKPMAGFDHILKGMNLPGTINTSSDRFSIPSFKGYRFEENQGLLFEFPRFDGKFMDDCMDQAKQILKEKDLA